jgi:hypothetical protein
MLTTIESRIAQELSATVHQVAAAVALLDEGATVPFISRYRKEATGGLDDTQLRNLQERLIYLRELEERRTAILTSIDAEARLAAHSTPCSRTVAAPRRWCDGRSASPGVQAYELSEREPQRRRAETH